MTDGFVIGLSIGLCIFIIVACITCIVRRSRAKQGRGRVFEEFNASETNMDILIFFILFVKVGFIIILIVLLTIGGLIFLKTYYRKKKQAVAPVVVTSASHTAPGGYPTTMQTMPVYQPPGNANYQQAVYPQQPPYPMSGQPPAMQMAMPMPMQQSQMHPNPMGMSPQMMPPYPVAGPSTLPPSYDSAVGTNPNMTANPMGYEKQAAYNPNYTPGTGY